MNHPVKKQGGAKSLLPDKGEAFQLSHGGKSMDVIMQRTPMEVLMAVSGTENSIVTPRLYIRFLDDLPAAMLLSQLMYWTPKTNKSAQGWIYKTYADWYDELLLTRRQVTRAKDLLVDRQFIEVKLKQLMNKSTVLHYRVLQENLMHALLTFEDVYERLLDVTKGNIPDVTKGNIVGDSHNVTPGCDEKLNATITKSTSIDYKQRVRAEKPPTADAPAALDATKPIEKSKDEAKQEYAQELTGELDKILPDKYRIGKLPKYYTTKILVLCTTIEPETLEDYTRWYLEVKEPTKSFTLGLFLSKSMGLEFTVVCAEWKKTKKGKKTTTNWKDVKDNGAYERFKKSMEGK